MKVAFLFMLGIAAVSGQSCLGVAGLKCCTSNDQCPTDELDIEGACCRVEQECCNEIPALGPISGLFRCCNAGTSCQFTPGTMQSRQSCLPDAPTPAPPAPTAAPPAPTAAPPAPTAAAPTSAPAPTAAAPTPELTCHDYHDCKHCADHGCAWIQTQSVAGCAESCDAAQAFDPPSLCVDAHSHDSSMGMATHLDTCPGYVEVDAQKERYGTCWHRCDHGHEFGWKAYRAGNIPADHLPFNGTGYPAAGLPQYASECSCDMDCRSRVDAHGHDDCCVDATLYCGVSGFDAAPSVGTWFRYAGGMVDTACKTGKQPGDIVPDSCCNGGVVAGAGAETSPMTMECKDDSENIEGWFLGLTCENGQFQLGDDCDEGCGDTCKENHPVMPGKCVYTVPAGGDEWMLWLNPEASCPDTSVGLWFGYPGGMVDTACKTGKQPGDIVPDSCCNGGVVAEGDEADPVYLQCANDAEYNPDWFFGLTCDMNGQFQLGDDCDEGCGDTCKENHPVMPGKCVYTVPAGDDEWMLWLNPEASC